MPEFVGGESAMMQFIQTNVKYPDYEKNKRIIGTCYITFVIEKDGTMTGAKILKGVGGGPGCDKESLRVVNLMPKWIPGLLFGKPARIQFNLPIKFMLR